jgi:hypothetical protein
MQGAVMVCGLSLEGVQHRSSTLLPAHPYP